MLFLSNCVHNVDSNNGLTKISNYSVPVERDESITDSGMTRYMKGYKG